MAKKHYTTHASVEKKTDKMLQGYAKLKYFAKKLSIIKTRMTHIRIETEKEHLRDKN